MSAANIGLIHDLNRRYGVDITSEEVETIRGLTDSILNVSVGSTSADGRWSFA
jgi:hypothetical protein